LEFVLGSDYELKADYVMDLLRLASITSEHDAKKAGAEVVKQTENAPLSGLLYPLMQALGMGSHALCRISRMLILE
jgi:tyrosyl-tRNA synthetase